MINFKPRLQNKAILVPAEQVKSLGEDVRELKTLIQSET